MFGLTRWSPLGSVFQLHREVDEMFSRFLGHGSAPQASEGGTPAWWPAMESYSEDGNLCVRLALPGVEPKDVEVSVTDDVVTVRGERQTKNERNGGYLLREFSYGTFERSFTLPQGVDPGKITARYANGMLELTMPAPVAEMPRKVDIQIEGGTAERKVVKAG